MKSLQQAFTVRIVKHDLSVCGMGKLNVKQLYSDICYWRHLKKAFL